MHWGFHNREAPAPLPRASAALVAVAAAQLAPVASRRRPGLENAGQVSGTPVGHTRWCATGPPNTQDVVLKADQATRVDVEELAAEAGNENSALAPNAIDGNPVAQPASISLGQVFGGLKQGTG